jgi:hypothetical protein
MIDRRHAIERISLILGGALSTQMTAGVMGEILNKGASIKISADQKALLIEVADIIIPTTDTPGAKAAGVEAFIIHLIRDCYELPEQMTFYAGLAKIDAASEKAHGKKFVKLSVAERNGIITDATKTNKAFFKHMKQLTVTGYFTSEIGATQALEYLPIPGGFQGDVPLKPGQKAWAILR